jgi:ABC-type bacteriocin/lantibiotic exporter with double-glycine peptidase domain
MSLTAYAFLSRHADIGILNSARAFTSLAFLELFAASFLQFIQTVSEVATAIGCIKQIDNFLHLDGQRDSRIVVPIPFSSDQDMDRLKTPTNNICLEAQGLSVAWSKDAKNVLHDLSFRVPESTLTMIFGPVGCGKTTLLSALLGETEIIAGTLRVNSKRIAYCAQTAWLMNATVQQNIIGDGTFDPQWYHTVIESCDLSKDISTMSNGDQTRVGSKGISLSGGQRHRLVRSLKPWLTFDSPNLTFVSIFRLLRALCTQRFELSFWMIFSAASIQRQCRIFHRAFLVPRDF